MIGIPEAPFTLVFTDEEELHTFVAIMAAYVFKAKNIKDSGLPEKFNLTAYKGRGRNLALDLSLRVALTKGLVTEEQAHKILEDLSAQYKKEEEAGGPADVNTNSTDSLNMNDFNMFDSEGDNQ